MGCCLGGTTEIKISFVIFNEHTFSFSHRNKEVFLSGTSCPYVCVLVVNQFRHECTKQQLVPRFILTQSKLISFHAITSSFIFHGFDSWVITSNRLCLVCGCVNLFCLFGFPNSCQSSESLTCGVCVSLSLLILYFCSWDSFRHLVWLSLTVLKKERQDSLIHDFNICSWFCATLHRLHSNLLSRLRGISSSVSVLQLTVSLNRKIVWFEVLIINYFNLE